MCVHTIKLLMLLTLIANMSLIGLKEMQVMMRVLEFTSGFEV